MAHKNMVRLSLSLLAGIIALNLIHGNCHAFYPLVADDYDPVDVGKTQIEVYYTSILNQDASQIGSVGFQVKKGVDANFDIGFKVPILLPQISGIDRSYFRAKWGLPGYASREGFSARIEAGVENNPMSRRIIKGALNFSGSLIYSKMLGSVETHSRIGLAKAGGWHADNLLDWYTVSSVTAVIPVEEVGAELVLEYNLNTSETPNPQMVQFGTKKVLLDWLAVNLGYSVGLNSNSPVRLCAIGLSYIF
jgi:hypothetical protein